MSSAFLATPSLFLSDIHRFRNALGWRRDYLLVNLLQFFGNLGIEIADVFGEVAQVVDNPFEDTFEALGGILEREDCFEVEGTLEADLFR